MKSPQDQAQFFRLLVKLLNYMTSGKSHIGYLCNNPGNPCAVRPVFSLQFELLMVATGYP